MNSLRLLIQILIIYAMLSTLLGMIRPWWVLWWMDSQYRLKVLYVYFFPGALLIMGYLLLF